jgi:TatD DNase family protein
VTLVDTHAHIQEPEFKDDLDAVVARARAAGVSQMIVPAVDLDTARAAIALAETYEGLYATAGFHPHEANRLTDDALAEVEALLAHPKVVAVGEIGLDYFRLHSTREDQLAALSKMLALAEQHARPVIIHCRDAWEDTAAVLRAWARRVEASFDGRPVGVMHYFSGSVEQAHDYIKLGFLISMHTSVTHPRSQQMREVAAAVPLESMVIETDSPYGAPQAYRGKRNEPAYVVESCRQIARERGISETLVTEATAANARRLFRIPAEEAAARYTGAAT